jgi:hypothetical protein
MDVGGLGVGIAYRKRGGTRLRTWFGGMLAAMMAQDKIGLQGYCCYPGRDKDGG